MAGKAVPNFVASRDSLPFTNDWPSQPDLVISLPLPGRAASLRIGDASNGLCGGMVYAVRDFFEAGIPVPAGPRPAAGTPLYRYIVSRLFDSFDIPGGVLKYYGWMNLPDADQSLLGWPATASPGAQSTRSGRGSGTTSTPGTRARSASSPCDPSTPGTSAGATRPSPTPTTSRDPF
jgi:hypothetical protein